MLSREKWQQLHIRMFSLGICETDLIEKFILGSGSGGQKINKTSSCVWLKHIPSGIMIKCQKERSREMNRYIARKRLCEKLDVKLHQEKSAREQLIEKIRRQKRRRSKKAKEKMLANKKHQAKQKKLRQTQFRFKDYSL